MLGLTFTMSLIQPLWYSASDDKSGRRALTEIQKKGGKGPIEAVRFRIVIRVLQAFVYVLQGWPGFLNILDND